MNNEKYVNHINQCWRFSEKTVEEELQLEGIIATNIKLKIFEKCLIPYHYFIEGNVKQEQKPTDKQLKLAKKLEIQNPESYTKDTISKKIDEVLQHG
jgi:hypothetical protein